MAARQQQEWTGRWLGLAVFFGGIALLLVVFFSARSLMGEPAPTVTTGVGQPGASAAGASAAMDLGRGLVQFVQRAILLLLMAVAGSLISSKGIQLYFAARPMNAGETDIVARSAES